MVAGGLVARGESGRWAAISPPARSRSPGAELITTGAYAHFRHPIYAGVVLLLAGLHPGVEQLDPGADRGLNCAAVLQGKGPARRRGG